MNLQQAQYLINQQKNTINSLNNQMIINKTHIDKIIQDKDNTISDLQKQNQDKDNTISELQKQNQDKDNTISELQKQVQEIKNNMTHNLNESDQIAKELTRQNISFKKSDTFIILS